MRDTRMDHIVNCLRELLEAERAGLDSLSLLVDYSSPPIHRGFVEKARYDLAWICNGLAHCIRALGGMLTADRGEFALKVAAEESMIKRLHLARRGQEWVISRIDALLREPLPAALRDLLHDVKGIHRTNIQLCNRMIAERYVSTMN